MDAPGVQALLLQGELFDSSGQLLIPATELRNACKCELCVNSSDRQRNYHWADIPVDIGLESYEIDGRGTYHVRWKNDVPGFEDHVSSYSKQAISTAPIVKTWNGHTIFQRPTYLWGTEDYNMEASTIPYADFIGTPKSLASALNHLHTTGLVFITDVPKDELSVGKIAQRIGPLRNSFYGSTWDVKSVPNAKNVAYTSRNLGFHMDLLYMQEPPGLQLLHCMENTCEGGLSQFVDTYKALDVLLTKHGRRVFDLLTRGRVPYEYSNDGFYYYDRKPIVALSGYPYKYRYVQNSEHHSVLSRVQRVYWSPPFTAPHMRQEPVARNGRLDHVRELRVGQLFAATLEAPGMVFTTKLSPGTCVIFDNLRVCHARTAFDTSAGHRWLRGAYLDHQDFHSRMVDMESFMPQIQSSKRLAGVGDTSI